MTDKYINQYTYTGSQLHPTSSCDKFSSPATGQNTQTSYDPFKVQVGGNHYARFKIQPLEYIEKNKIPFADGCVIKYITRWRFKNGIEDLRKAKHFIDMLISLEEQKKTNEQA